MIADLERTVAESELLHSHELHKLRIEIIEADGARQLAEQRLGYREQDLRRTRATIRSLCDALQAGIGAPDDPPVGMDPREWIK
jgi:hypothetical protein